MFHTYFFIVTGFYKQFWLSNQTGFIWKSHFFNPSIEMVS